MKKYNPNCEYLSECVDFRDIQDDWLEVCEALGEPMTIDAQVYSYTRRYMAYWSNLVRGKDMPPPTPRDPDTCMIGGRTLIRHMMNAKPSVQQVGGTWRGDPNNPYATTARPILVNDPEHEKPQHIKVKEAEQLNGHNEGSTTGRDVTNKMRLEAIGRG